MRWLFLLLGCLAANVSLAGVTFTPHPGFYTPPSYFSGTNCRAHYRAEIAYPSTHLYSARIKINGETTWEAPFLPLPPLPWFPSRVNVFGKVMFDSLHFGNVGAVVVRMEVETDAGSFEHSYVASLKNNFRAWSYQGLSAGGPALSDGSTIAGQLMSSVGYSAGSVHGNGWTRSQMLDGMSGVNSLAVFSHGNPTWFSSDTDEVIRFASELEPLNSVLGSREFQVGQLLPPYNSAEPSINLAVTYACRSGLAGSHVYFLYPYESAYVPGQIENQASVGLNSYGVTTEADDFSESLFGRMSEGWTVDHAISHMIQFEHHLAYDKIDGVFVIRQMVVSDVAIAGDGNTRIFYVYDGEQHGGNDPGWWRIISSG